MKQRVDVFWKDEKISRDKLGKNARNKKEDKKLLVDLITDICARHENKQTNKIGVAEPALLGHSPPVSTHS